MKADNHFLRLQQKPVNTEERLQAARRFFNANVRELNNRVESILSSLAGIHQPEFSEVEWPTFRAPFVPEF